MDPPADPQPRANQLPVRPVPNPGSTLLSYLKGIITDANDSVNLDKTTVAVLLHLIESEARVQKQLQEISARLESIEVNQLTRQTPPTYTSKVAKPSAIPKPPTKQEMTLARPGRTIIHAKTGTHPLKEINCEQIVQQTNAVLDKLNTTVQGEKVAIKAVRILPSGDVTFFSKNRIHKEWLNKNKHEWSKQLHPDLEATPSTYVILAHRVPSSFDTEAATSRIKLASDNGFLAEKIF